jgi:ABC-type multidrug transport system fused ATPase/permease subunit
MSSFVFTTDSTYKSPVYAIISDCAANAITLRSLGVQVISYYERKLINAFDDSLRVFLSLSVASQWLGMRLQLFGCFLTFSISLSAVLLTVYHFANISPSLLGLALTYSLTLVGNLNNLVGSLTETEQEMVAVERMRQYCTLPTEYDGDDNSTNTCKSNQAVETTIFRSPEKSSSIYESVQTDDIEAPLMANPMHSRDEWEENAQRTEVLSSKGGKSLNENAIPRSVGIADVEFIDVSLRYAPHLPFALRNASFRLAPGSRVAVVGNFLKLYICTCFI